MLLHCRERKRETREEERVLEGRLEKGRDRENERVWEGRWEKGSREKEAGEMEEGETTRENKVAFFHPVIISSCLWEIRVDESQASKSMQISFVWLISHM